MHPLPRPRRWARHPDCWALPPQAADCWGLGVLLYILLTGLSPFQRNCDAKLATKDRMQALLQVSASAEAAVRPHAAAVACCAFLAPRLSC